MKCSYLSFRNGEPMVEHYPMMEMSIVYSSFTEKTRMVMMLELGIVIATDTTRTTN